MIALWCNWLLSALLLLLIAIIMALMTDLSIGIGLLALSLLLIHSYHLLQLTRLNKWLKQTRQDNILPTPPEALGMWGNTFTDLFRLQRSARAVQQQLASTLDHFRTALEALPEGVTLLNSNLRIEWINPQSAKDLGLNPVVDRGTLISHLIRDPIFINYLANGNEPIVLRRFNRAISVTLVPFTGGGFLLISRDISAIEHADLMRRDFIANASHELRTPLTVIIGFLETLLDEPLIKASDNNYTALTLIAEQANRMKHLIEDLLTLSRLDEHQTLCNEEIIDIPSLLLTLKQEALALSAGNHTISLQIHTEKGITGNFQELRSAFTNLISNAIRYTPSGGQIILCWQLLNNQLIFEVIDNGVGIAAEHIPRLTERFYRVDKSRSSATGGTGLGLAIVKHVLSRHNAQLQIQSEIGQGSTFRVVFFNKFI